MSALLGSNWEVRDIQTALPSVDVVLVGRCSPQAVIGLRRDFPHATVVVVERDDGVEVPDVCRCLSAGAAAHVRVQGVADLAAAALGMAGGHPLAA